MRQLPAEQLTADWLQQHGAFRPLLVPAAPGAARQLGIALPEGSLTVDRLASKIGLPFEVGWGAEVCGGEAGGWGRQGVGMLCHR